MCLLPSLNNKLYVDIMVMILSSQGEPGEKGDQGEEGLMGSTGPDGDMVSIAL